VAAIHVAGVHCDPCGAMQPYPSLNEKDQVSWPYRTTAANLWSPVFVFMCLDNKQKIKNSGLNRSRIQIGELHYDRCSRICVVREGDD